MQLFIEMNHYIYLIQPIRFLEQNEPTYKIGKTTTNIFEYLQKKYLKTSKVIFTSEVINCHELEREIINLFDKIFVKRTDVGLEYYTGNVNKMVEILGLLVLKQKIVVESFKELPKIKQFVENKQEYVKTLLEDNVDSVDSVDNKNVIKELNELDELGEPDDPNGSDESDELCVSTNQTQHNELIMDFINHIKNTKPEWFTPGIFISKDLLQQKYEDFSEQQITKTRFHRLFNDKLFNNSRRDTKNNKKITMVRLKKYEHF